MEPHYQQIPISPQDIEQSTIPQETYGGESQYMTTSQGLPKYPGSPSRSYRQNSNSLPSYEENIYYQENDQSYPYYEETIPEAPVEKRSKRKPKKPKNRWKTIIKIIGALLLIVLAAMIFMFVKGMGDVQSGKKSYKPAVVEDFNGINSKNGTNILVLGSDQRVTQGSADARTDTIMVVNVGNKSNKVKMVSFMRDTLVNIPGYSADSYSLDLKLNSSFNLGEQDGNKGAEFVRKTLKHNYGIDIKYYVMVDFETFAEAIDTLFPNGVKIDAKFSTVDGEAVDSVEVPDDLRMKNGVVPNQTIKVGEQRMDGRTLLNYARFRHDDQGDYGRTVRQQQVIAAVIQQIKDTTKLFTGSAAIGKVFALTSTNISYPFILSHGVSVLSDAKNGVQQKSIPEEGDWVDDYDMYGGQALYVDFAKYKKELKKMGLR